MIIQVWMTSLIIWCGTHPSYSPSCSNGSSQVRHQWEYIVLIVLFYFIILYEHYHRTSFRAAFPVRWIDKAWWASTAARHDAAIDGRQATAHLDGEDVSSFEQLQLVVGDKWLAY